VFDDWCLMMLPQFLLRHRVAATRLADKAMMIFEL